MNSVPFKSVVSITERTIPHALIDGIRRRFKSMDQNAWDPDQELKPELDVTAGLPSHTAVLVSATPTAGRFSPKDENTPDYYKSLVATAIQNGGWHGGHRIPVPWLRMILAGLELKHIEPEMMWYGVEAGPPSGDSLDVPPYNDLFPSDRDTSKGPEP